MNNTFIILGIILIAMGIFLSGNFPRLPGDIFISRPGFTFYFPITTMIIVSVVLTVLLRIFNR